jgi:hypothetical protein
MSAAHKSYIPVPVSRQKSQASQRRPQSPVNQATPTAKPATKSVERVPVAPTQKQLASRQLRSLCLLERIVAVITFCLLGSTLGIYAWTVYIPKVWDKEFGKLETLQRHERHLLATNETLKHQLAQQAEKPETGLTETVSRFSIPIYRQFSTQKCLLTVISYQLSVGKLKVIRCEFLIVQY